MAVLHWWFVTVPLFLVHHLGDGGVLPLIGELVAIAGYAAITFLAVVAVLAGVMAVLRALVRGFAAGFRQTR